MFEALDLNSDPERDASNPVYVLTWNWALTQRPDPVKMQSGSSLDGPDPLQNILNGVAHNLAKKFYPPSSDFEWTRD